MELFKEVSFPVELRDLPHPTKAGSKIPGRKGIVRTDTDEVLNIVSDRYPLVPHITVFGAMEEAINLLGIAVLSRRVRSAYSGGYAKATWTLDREMVVRDHGLEDRSQITISARNSYNYSSLVGLELGVLRLICTNGMRAFVREASFQKRHTPSLNVPDLLNQITGMLEKTNEVEEKFSAWNQMEYTRERFAQWLAKGTMSKDGRQEVLDYFSTQPDRARNGTEPVFSGWEAVNALTWFASHRAKSRNPDTLLIAAERVQDMAQAFSIEELGDSIASRRN